MIDDQSKNLTPIRFHFFTVKFTPYNDNKAESSESIMHKVMTYLMQQQQAGKGFLIDKHKERANDGERPLFVTSSSFDFKQKRIKCSMALLRTGKKPLIKPLEKFTLVELDTSNGQIAEQTHFFIDYSTSQVAMCCEFNYNGPRISDIEYYFRIVARDQLRIGKFCDVQMIMDASLDKALADLKNILNFEIKVEPQRLSALQTDIVGEYFTGLSNLGQKVRPNFIKLEASFQTPDKNIVGLEVNKQANTMIRKLLNAFKTKKENIDVFDHFFIKYSDENGKEDFFNLFKGKKEIIKEIDLTKIKGPRQWHDLISDDLTEFVKSLS